MSHQFFNKQVSENYDTRAQRVASINANLHFLIGLALANLPETARILCIGSGTGTEIVELAKANPRWHFTAVEPSEAMVDVCREELREAKLEDRCTILNSYLENASTPLDFDAALCLLVAHFVKGDARSALFSEIARRIKSQGLLVHSEISYERHSPSFSAEFENWKRLQIAWGAAPDKTDGLLKSLDENLAVRSPSEIEKLLRETGFENPMRFFQSFFISAWISQKK